MKHMLWSFPLSFLLLVGFPHIVQSDYLAPPAHVISTHKAAHIYPYGDRNSIKPLTNAQIALKQAVDVAFATTPEMDAVVRCESGFRQFDEDGKPLISPTHDVGVAQINIPTWAKEARDRGLDIFNSATDNIEMAKIVLKEQGIHAWTCAG